MSAGGWSWKLAASLLAERRRGQCWVSVLGVLGTGVSTSLVSPKSLSLLPPTPPRAHQMFSLQDPLSLLLFGASYISARAFYCSSSPPTPPKERWVTLAICPLVAERSSWMFS